MVCGFEQGLSPQNVVVIIEPSVKPLSLISVSLNCLTEKTGEKCQHTVYRLQFLLYYEPLLVTQLTKVWS